MEQNAQSKPTEIIVEAVVIRGPNSAYGPPGQVEALGPVSYWHRNPIRRLLWRLRRRS